MELIVIMVVKIYYGIIFSSVSLIVLWISVIKMTVSSWLFMVIARWNRTFINASCSTSFVEDLPQITYR